LPGSAAAGNLSFVENTPCVEKVDRHLLAVTSSDLLNRLLFH